MDAENLTFSLSFVQWLITGGVAIYAWYIGRQSASVKETVLIRERLIALEMAMKEVPSQMAISNVNQRLERLDAELTSNNRELHSMHTTLNRINDFLLNNK